MNPQIEAKLRRIERLSVLFRGSCSVLIAIFGIATLVATMATFAGRLTKLSTFGQSIALQDATARAPVIVAGLVLVTGAVIIKALYHLRTLSGNYARRDFFTTDSVRQIRNFGVSCIFWGLVEVAWAFLPAVLPASPPVAVHLTIDSLLIGAVIVAISWLAEMAAVLREESELTI
ncbi:MAG TPA: DUF2975 domain-containing protein [Candidatus Didemnitutus sp.]|jgi:hypothetical protein